MSLAGSVQAGAQENKVTATGEAGALTPAPSTMTAPAPGKHLPGVQNLGVVVERYEGVWG